MDDFQMGKNWAIAIGINEYYNLRPLNYAKRDAEAIRTFCLNEAQFQQVDFFAEDAPPIATDYGPPLQSQPTFGNLERYLEVRFKARFLKAGDNLWFFFAGHGKRERGRDYLMPLDGSPRNVERTGLAIREIADRLRCSGADNVILMLDACRSEDDRDGGEGIGLEPQQGVVTLFSCSPNELSYEIDELQQGAFTYALLEGLRNQGQGNCATVERLYQHLRYRVPELNRCHQERAQHPYAIAEPVTKFNLILLPQYATLGDISALKNDAQEAELEGDLDLAEQLWIRVLAASPADLQAVRAIQRIAIRRATTPPPSPSPTSRTPQVESLRPSQPQPKPTFEFEVVTVDEHGQIRDRRQARAEYRIEDLGNGVTLEMVAIPGGTFQMGAPDGEAGRSDDEGPQHAVTVAPFYMGKFPITQAQWKAVATFPKIERDLNPDPSRFKGGNRPVECVSWHAAVEFCQRLSKQTGRDYRLPSEAEWEYACRAGTTSPFSFGETITPELANYDGNYTYGSGPKGISREETTPVGSFSPNAFGLYDMHGNVWDWCEDWWHESYAGAPPGGTPWITGGDESYRVLRGGSWVNNPGSCRSADRSWFEPVGRYNFIGFRVVCSSA
jgi:formylglycine-generating enzyme required for sulfatase activity